MTAPADSAAVPSAEGMARLGVLTHLAAHCPLHRNFTLRQLHRLVLPAIVHDTVRFFDNDAGQPCAALIWARLTAGAEQRLIQFNELPAPDEWVAGDRLWFVDLLAPFGHGRWLAAHIARNPPEEVFRFARIGRDGKIWKVTRGDAAARGKGGALRTSLYLRRAQA